MPIAGVDDRPPHAHLTGMTDPFLLPEDETAADAIAAIGEELDIFDDWMDRYAHIIELGRKLPPFPAEWQNDDHRVPGCQSQVWFEAALREGKLYFAGASDAAIVSGLVALMLRVYSGRPPAEIAATDPAFLKDLGLIQALSTNRGNGIASMARKSLPMNWAVLIAACTSGMYLSNGVNMSFFAALLEDRGLVPSEISLILGVAFLARVIAGPIWGMLGDRLGQIRPVLATSMTIAIVATLSVLAWQGFWQLFASVMLYAVGASALMPLFDMLTLAAARRLGFDFGRVRAAGSTAFMLGALGTGFVISATGLHAVAWLMAGFTLFSLAMLPLMPEASERRRPGAAPVSLDPMPLRIPAFRQLLAISALLQGTHAAYYALSTLHWRAAGLSDELIGLLWAEAVLAEILVLIFCRRIIARLGPANLMMIGAVGAGLRWTATALSVDPLVLAAIQPLHAASFTMPYLAALQIMGHCVPASRAASAQSLNAAIGVAAPTGVLMFASGLLYTHSGGLVFLLMAALALTCLIQADAFRWHLLDVVRSLELPDCWIGAGFVRNAVWDHLHGRPPSPPDGDINVIWYDPATPDASGDRRHETALAGLVPGVVCDRPYTSASDAMRFWPETATAIAARRTRKEACEIAAPHGVADLLHLILQPTPHFAHRKRSIYEDRLASKQWTRRWPLLQRAAG
eukprot:gene5732-5795_t